MSNEKTLFETVVGDTSRNLERIGRENERGALFESSAAQHRNQIALQNRMNGVRDEVSQLRRENSELQEDNERLIESATRARSLLESMVMRNEAFARTIVHLRKSWVPDASRSQSDQIIEILDDKESVVAGDQAFREKTKKWAKSII